MPKPCWMKNAKTFPNPICPTFQTLWGHHSINKITSLGLVYLNVNLGTHTVDQGRLYIYILFAIAEQYVYTNMHVLMYQGRLYMCSWVEAASPLNGWFLGIILSPNMDGCRFSCTPQTSNATGFFLLNMADFLPAICKIHQYFLYLHKQNGGLSNQLCFSRVYQRVLSLKLTRLNRLLTPLPSSNHPFFRKKQLAVLGRFTLNVMATAALTQKDSFKNTVHPFTLSSIFFVALIPHYQLIWEKISTIF